MKKSILSLCLLAGVAGTAFAQNTFPTNGSAGIGTAAPDASAILEMQSTAKGMLVPRMTKAQRDAIATPATGLMIYQTNGTSGFYYFSGSSWSAISTKGANKSLSNLTAPTSINAELLPEADNSINLGSAALSWKDLYIDGVGYLGSAAKVGNFTGTPQTGMIRWSGTDFQGYNGTAWVSLTASGVGAETDPEVGANTTSFIPRWNGTALVTGLIQDNGSKIGINKAPDTEHRLSSLRQVTSGFSSTIYSALRGENNAAGSSTINSVGYIGINNPSGLYPLVFPDIDIVDIGTLGVKNSNTTKGAGLYGWNRGGAGSNFGVMGAASSSTGINYGLYGRATSTNSVGVNYGMYANVEGAAGNYGVYGKVVTATGQFGYGVFGSASGTGTNYAGFFSGHTYVGEDNEALTISGVNPYIQFKDGSTENAYVRASGSDLLLATNSGNASGKVVLRTNGVGRVWVDASGNVSIGSSAKVATGYMLSVVGKVIAEEVRVELNGTWPDYVFAKDYQLMPLQNLKKYVFENNHLPEVPAAEEMKNGIEVGKMNKLLMQKVEELTLYIIQLNEDVQELKKQNK